MASKKRKPAKRPPSWKVRSKQIGKSAYDSIVEMVKHLDDENDERQEGARNAIQEDALDLTLTGRGNPSDGLTADGFELLLSTGGPAVRIVGTLNDCLEPDSARLEVQDWFQPWTEYRCDEGPLLQYAQCFYFGEPS